MNKPLRCAEFSERFRSQQKNKPDWDHICSVLNRIAEKNDPNFTALVFKQVLTEIHRQLSKTRVVYPVPLRIGQSKTIKLLSDFLSTQSGGDRLLALAAALFTMIGNRFGLFTTVRRAGITTSDGSAGMLADLECVSEQGKIVMVVEIKDRVLTINQLRSKVPDIRERHVSEIFFVTQKGISTTEESDIKNLIDREYAGGYNIYVLTFSELSNVVSALLGGKGRREFLLEVGNQLDKHSNIIHRRAWAALLRNI